MYKITKKSRFYGFLSKNVSYDRYYWIKQKKNVTQVMKNLNNI